MQDLNDVSGIPLIVVCVLRVHREQQESRAHADREDQRLVLLSRLVLPCRWRTWHLSKSGRSTWACSKGNPHWDNNQAFQITCIFYKLFFIKKLFFFFLKGPRGERGPRGPTGKAGPKVSISIYFNATFWNISLYMFTFDSLFFVSRVTQGMTAHRDLPVRGYVPSQHHQESFYSRDVQRFWSDTWLLTQLCAFLIFIGIAWASGTNRFPRTKGPPCKSRHSTEIWPLPFVFPFCVTFKINSLICLKFSGTCRERRIARTSWTERRNCE